MKYLSVGKCNFLIIDRNHSECSEEKIDVAKGCVYWTVAPKRLFVYSPIA
jgi:hypothetical protein